MCRPTLILAGGGLARRASGIGAQGYTEVKRPDDLPLLSYFPLIRMVVIQYNELLSMKATAVERRLYVLVMLSV